MVLTQFVRTCHGGFVSLAVPYVDDLWTSYLLVKIRRRTYATLRARQVPAVVILIVSHSVSCKVERPHQQRFKHCVAIASAFYWAIVVDDNS